MYRIPAMAHTAPVLVFSTLLLVALAACGDKREEQRPADESAPPRKVSQKVSDTTQKDDPMIGDWEVVRATGRWAQANEGMTLAFEPDGGLVMAAVSTGDNPTGRFMPHVDAGELIVNVWSWRRTGPDKLELTFPGDPSTAYITTEMQGDTLVFNWSNGAQVFYMKRMKQDGAPAPEGKTSTAEEGSKGASKPRRGD